MFLPRPPSPADRNTEPRVLGTPKKIVPGHKEKKPTQRGGKAIANDWGIHRPMGGTVTMPSAKEVTGREPDDWLWKNMPTLTAEEVYAMSPAQKKAMTERAKKTYEEYLNLFFRA